MMIRSNTNRDILHRWEGNPILTLEDIPFPCNTVFNGTPVKLGDQYILMLRIEGQQGHSFFTIARSIDGLHFDVDIKPVMQIARNGPYKIYEERGIEDPRATYLDGTYYIMYTAVGRYGYRIALAQTDDFKQINRIAIVSEPGNKDGVLFPEKINGRYARLDRPIGLGIGSIWVSYSKDLISWGDSQLVFSPRRGYWDSFRVGASVPPIKTDRGWLEIYHGTKMTSAGPIYRAGIAILDLNNPAKVICRSKVPLLSPREDYERIGDVGNVIFPCGAIVEPDGEIKVYYGAADTCVGVAISTLDQLMDCPEGENTI